MRIDLFFEMFDQLADAPNAVAKMRELILQLAAHGKLVKQSRDDEPASALVGRIDKHFEELRRQKELRGSPIEPLDREELPRIPLSWEWVRLGNVVDYGSSDKAESADIPEDAWLLDLEDIEKDTSRLLQRKSFRDSPSKSTKTAFTVGDVLYGKLRPYLNKVIVADAPGYCTTEIIPIRAFGFIEPAYLCYALKRPEFIAYANSKSYGMNLPRLGTEDARNAPFPLPPLAEQRRIVAKVDELLALCDRLEAQQQERETRHAALASASLARFADAPTPANLYFVFHDSYTIEPADLRKAILTLAVQGKLVPHDPTDEAADRLLERLRSREAQGNDRRRKAEPMQSISPDEIPFELPTGWAWERLGNIGETNIGLTYSPQDVSEVGIPILRSSNIQNGRLDLSDLVRVKGEPKKSVMVQEGDLLICARNGSRALVGKVAVIEGMSEPAAFGAFMAIFRSEMNNYLYHFICSPLFRQVIDEVNTTTINQITQSNLRSTLAPIPPLAEQRRIVAKVNQLMALVDQLEGQLAASRATASALMESFVSGLTAEV